MSQNLKVLYQDKTITITELYILIKKYYMPLMTSKTIMFDECKTISIEDARNVNQSWGINTHHLNNWFQYDPDRKSKPRFISIELKNSRIRPAITPEDVDQAFNVLREHFASLARKSVMFQSNRDKETELNHKEMHEMMKQQQQHETQNKEKKTEQPAQIQEKLENSQQQLTVGKGNVSVQDVE